VINCNPETVSTDHDVSDRLYFEELTFERIADIYEFEMPYGMIVSVGGQIPNTLAKTLQEYGCQLLGTDATHIDQAENRSKFSHLLDTLGIQQPAWDAFTTLEELTNFADRVGYPVLVRPSYVLSGSAMSVCYSKEELHYYAQQAAAVSGEHPATISQFYEKAREVELDAVAQRGLIKAFVISEHIENAGVHSGDATLVLPPQTIPEHVQRTIEQAGRAIAQALQITGPINIQFLVKDQQVLVIEANVRASRTFPFIAKVTGVNMMELFVDALFKEEVAEITVPTLTFTAVKAPQFSFSRLSGADPIQGVEMASTGEVASFGDDVEEAYLKAMLAVGGTIPHKGIFVCLGGDEKKDAFVDCVQELVPLGLPLYAPEETWELLQAHGIEARKLIHTDVQANSDLLSCFRNGMVDLAIVVVSGRMHKDLDKYYMMRRLAIDTNTYLLTKIKQIRLFGKALHDKDLETIAVKSWQEYQLA
jgi:carbamoyl-phosphate synthase large subunit